MRRRNIIISIVAPTTSTSTTTTTKVKKITAFVAISVLIIMANASSSSSSSSPSPSSAAAAHVVQFVVHANEKTDVSRLFTGAYVDFTWNNVFVVSIWTNDPDSLVKSINDTLNSNTNILQILVPPYTIEASTQKWLQYNLVWVLTLALVFVAGCVCGGVLISQCLAARKAVFYSPVHHNNNNNNHNNNKNNSSSRRRTAEENGVGF